MSRIAIKRLSKSDLTFFVWHFRNMNAGNQKSINLNANIFIDDLYPDLPNISAQRGKSSFLVDVSIFGPGKAPRHSLARKIVKGAAYKNWRLNGEFVDSPLETPERYNSLREGDYAILNFSGDPVPDELKLILVSAHVNEDAKLHSRISAVMGSSSMKALSNAQLESIVGDADIDDSHAARIMGIESAFEDASQGGLNGAQTLKKWSAKRHISKDDLRKARDKADATGILGEEFVNYYLQLLVGDGLISEYEWSSNINAVEAYDFVIDGDKYLDVKSTAGSFSQTIHISINELLHMRDLPDYRIYRVYGIENKKAKLRISGPMQEFAAQVIDKIDPLLGGVRVDNISVSTDILAFESEIEIEMLSQEDD